MRFAPTSGISIMTQGKDSYNSTPNKVPHGIYSILASRGCHVCLMKVGLHGIVVGELLLQGFQFDYKVFPILVGS